MMDRLVLFRAHPEENRKDWVYGFYVSVFNDYTRMRDHFIIDQHNGKKTLVDGYSVSMLTGLYDNDHNDIWENDVLVEWGINKPFKYEIKKRFKVKWSGILGMWVAEETESGLTMSLFRLTHSHFGNLFVERKARGGSSV